MTRYRFRVRGPDGPEQVSEVFVSGAGTADDASASSPGDLDKLLEAPEWSNAEFGHGETATLRVKGKGLEGRQIKFVLEHRSGDNWVPYGEATGAMKGGVATATLPVQHPVLKAGGGKPGAPASDLDKLLESPAWSNAELTHGQSASLQVKGKGLDGQSIKFVLEHRSGDKWVPYGEATGQMKGGVATAQVPVHHPVLKAGGKHADATPADLRFHCQVIPAAANLENIDHAALRFHCRVM